jgi:hypothetical protein
LPHCRSASSRRPVGEGDVVGQGFLGPGGMRAL